jgi:hypothetical protein
MEVDMGLLDTSELLNAVAIEKQRRGPDEDIIERFRSDDALEVPIELTDLDLWSNYVNDDLYEMDVMVREFIKRTRYKRQAKNGYRTTASVVFAWIYGRQPEAADGAACRLIHTLLKYYCSSYTGATTFHGKPVTRVYRFTKFAGNSKRPYSLRLRLEEAKGGSDGIFRQGPDSKVDKRTYGRRANRPDGER